MSPSWPRLIAPVLDLTAASPLGVGRVLVPPGVNAPRGLDRPDSGVGRPLGGSAADRSSSGLLTALAGCLSDDTRHARFSVASAHQAPIRVPETPKAGWSREALYRRSGGLERCWREGTNQRPGARWRAAADMSG